VQVTCAGVALGDACLSRLLERREVSLDLAVGVDGVARAVALVRRRLGAGLRLGVGGFVGRLLVLAVEDCGVAFVLASGHDGPPFSWG
jgi:hypothetical protein